MSDENKLDSNWTTIKSRKSHAKCVDTKPFAKFSAPTTPNSLSLPATNPTSLTDLRCMRTIKRLYHDSVEVQRFLKQQQVTQVDTINDSTQVFAIAPVTTDNMFHWHGNIRGTGKFQEFIFHFHLHFPPNYPLSPPKLTFFSKVPHPNVFAKKLKQKVHEQGSSIKPAGDTGDDYDSMPGYYLCLDMLEETKVSQTETPLENMGWNSSYTVLSLMIQLQAFLLNDANMFQQTLATLSQVIYQAKTFVCRYCSHSAQQPHPQFMVTSKVSSETEAANNNNNRLSFPVDLFAITNHLTPSKKPSSSMNLIKCSDNSVADRNMKDLKFPKTDQEETKKLHPGTTSTKSINKQNPGMIPIKHVDLDQQVTKKPSETKIEPYHQSETSKRHLRRDRQRQARKLQLQRFPQSQSKDNTTTLNAFVELTSEELAGEAKSYGQTLVVENSKQKPLFLQILEQAPEIVKISQTTQRKTQFFSIRVLMVEVCTYLQVVEICAFGTVSHECSIYCCEGFLWKRLFMRRFLNKTPIITAQRMQDWKHTYLLEVNNIASSLVCFSSKTSLFDTKQSVVLGIPLVFTINPKTNEIDYIHSTMDLLSYEAYKVDNVRLAADNSTFTDFLPLYLTREHFLLGLPILENTILKLNAGNAGGFHPNMIVNVLPKLINTLIVLLSDKGIACSVKVCEGLVAIHRLFLACIQHYPELQRVIDEKVSSFIQSPERRLKRNLPSLGAFLALLSVSSQHLRWTSNFKLAQTYLEEQLTRNVIWVLKEYPSLQKPAQITPTTDWTRLEQTFKASLVSNRLLAFNVLFLRSFAPASCSDVELCRRYDPFYGRPSQYEIGEFQKQVKKVFVMKNWAQLYSCLGFKIPSPAIMTQVLVQCIKNSKTQGYHTDHTNFNAIQASGISTLLKKGQSYQASAKLKNVTFYDSWLMSGGSTYLDATVLCYDLETKTLIDYVDFNHTRAIALEFPTCIIHSGDVMNYDKQSGEHTVKIHLSSLPANCTGLFFVLSAYHSTLQRIKQPYVRFTDSEEGNELCRYDLEMKDCKDYSAVIMCSLIKNRVRNQWCIKAIGEMGYCVAGAAKHGYDALSKQILKHLP